MWSKLILIQLVIGISLPIFSQTTISGYVRDSSTKEPITITTVYWEQENLQTLTNENGFFILQLPPTVEKEITLHFASYSYETKKVSFPLTKDTIINIVLQATNERMLEEIKIKAKKSEELGLIQLPIERLKAIPMLGGEADIIKAYQFLPGIAGGQEGSSGLYVRGGSPDQNLFLIDNTPLYHVNHLGGFLSTFDAAMINSISLYKGGFPSKFSGRLSSIVDIRMKEGNPKKLKGEVAFGIISTKLQLEGPFTKKDSTWTFLLSFRRMNMDLLTRPFVAIVSEGSAAAQNEPLISPFWEKDAGYQYYKHGPLARVEIGNEKVQGVDYVYTAQGWIKGVNSNTLQSDRDPGKDGSSTGSNALTARDVFGFSLHYNDNDYKPIASSSGSFIASQTGSDVYNNGAQLYNGNIGRMVTTITKPDTREVLPLGNAYQYDQLNRLAHSKSFSNIDLSGNSWGNTGTYDNKYFNAFTYDANGNILTQIRHDSTGTKIDDLVYHYETNFAGRLLRNRLYQVNDAVNASTYSDDIDDMGTFDNDVNFINTNNNYSYDGEGRLTKDKQEEIDTIIWRVDGKVSEIRRTNGSAKKNLVFNYDAFGRRTAKKVYSSSNVLEKAVYYTLDAQGNTMATYNLNIDTLNSSLDFYQAEKFIYGNSRLGMLKDSVNVLGSAFTETDSTNVTHTLGNKRYELSNHLGNVLTVITDKPIPHNNGGTVDYWQASIASAYDYSPFGVMLTGRTFEGKQTICHDSTTLITQKTLEEGFSSWGSWTTMGSGLVTYVSGEMQVSNPSSSKKDIGASKTFTTGTGVHNVSFEVIGNTCATVVIWPPSSTPIPISVSVKDNYGNVVASGNYTTAGTYNLSFTPASAGANYTLEFHMTKASAFCFFRVDDVLVSYDDTTTVTVCKEVEEEYRYSFQGQEHDDEIKGKGNSYNYTYRMHDTRLGRFFAVDPLSKDYPHNSPYAFSENIVINAVELEGLEKAYVYNNYWDNETKSYLTVYSHTTNQKKFNGNVNRIDYYGSNGLVKKSEYKDLKGKVIFDPFTLMKYKSGGPGDPQWERKAYGTAQPAFLLDPITEIANEKAADGFEALGMSKENAQTAANITVFAATVFLTSKISSGSATKGVTVPKGWITQASKKGGGTVFKDPTNPHNIIRQMPGNPSSPNVLQQNPYVKFMKDGKFYDINGKVLPNGNVPGAHIPLNQFNINNMPKF